MMVSISERSSFLLFYIPYILLLNSFDATSIYDADKNARDPQLCIVEDLFILDNGIIYYKYKCYGYICYLQKKMDPKIGPERPLFVLFGSSIVQLSYYLHGWGATLTGLYARKADISVRGYIGWTSRNALQVLSKVFPRDDKIQPSLVILYFGGNDSTDLNIPDSPGVPLDEYVKNMRRIIFHIQGLSRNTRIIMLSAPAVNEKQIIEYYGSNLGRTNERGRIYSEAGIKLAQELGVKVIDFWSALQEPNDWMNTVFWDGMHLTKVGSDIVFHKITNIIKETEWEPTLDWEKIPDEFSDIDPNDLYLKKLMEGINRMMGISDSHELKSE